MIIRNVENAEDDPVKCIERLRLTYGERWPWRLFRRSPPSLQRLGITFVLRPNYWPFAIKRSISYENITVVTFTPPQNSFYGVSCPTRVFRP